MSLILELYMNIVKFLQYKSLLYMCVCFFGNYFINIYFFIILFFIHFFFILLRYAKCLKINRTCETGNDSNVTSKYRSDVYSFGTRALEHSDGYSRCIMGSGERFPFHIDERIYAL